MHSVSKIIKDGETQYCDFCRSSEYFDNGSPGAYLYIREERMNITSDHYGPEEDDMGDCIYFEEKAYSEEELKAVTVTFHANGGQIEEKTKGTNNSGRLSQFPVVTKRDCCFVGWYTGRTGGAKVSLSRVYKKDTTLYAHWRSAKPKKTSIDKIKITGNAVYVSCKKVSGAKGYQIRYSTTRAFTAKTTNVILNKRSKNVFTFLGQRRKTYYIMVRAYGIDSMGRKVYGQWSQIKTIKIY